MKLSNALFASVVTICCTVGIVAGQIQFADGSIQSTAFTGASESAPVVTAANRFNFTDTSDYTWSSEFGTLPGRPGW